MSGDRMAPFTGHGAQPHDDDGDASGSGRHYWSKWYRSDAIDWAQVAPWAYGEEVDPEADEADEAAARRLAERARRREERRERVRKATATAV